ncbi:MAG: hypothetical protein ACFCU3_07265 [Verrucomicrobiales bacterium]
METGFFGKVIISIVAGFGLACIVQVVKFVNSADDALNDPYRRGNTIETQTR